MNQATVYNAPDFIAYIFYIKQDVGVKSEDHILEVVLDNNYRVVDVVAEFEIRDTTVRHLGENQAYSMASAVEVNLTTTAKLVRYLQDITAHGVSHDSI
jgi:mRNA-degrading endonuclease HigB of HigAB toxin-antitoxin module